MKFSRILFAALGLTAFLAWADGLPDLGDASETLLSPRQERRLGDEIMASIRIDRDYLDDPEITDYLNDLGYRLASHSPAVRQEFQFFLVRDAALNAFALPGGYIGVHTGLIVAAQNESELAGVLSHEIAHVAQKHLARMLEGQKQSQLTSIAALAVAILASRSNSQVSQAAIATAQASSIQSQLNFTREHEREADRVGFQILDQAGFDVRGMGSFFERLQRSTRLYEGNAPSYLRTHPLTYERIADVQNRIQSRPYKQVADSAEFQLARAKLKAAQDTPRDAVNFFEEALKRRNFGTEASTRYGLATALLRDNNAARAQKEMGVLRRLLPAHPMVASLDCRVESAQSPAKGLDCYRAALKRYSGYRGLIHDAAEALLRQRQADEALQLLAAQIQLYPSDAELRFLEAKAYAAQGKILLQRRSQAEGYALLGRLQSAIEQLQLGVKAGDGDFFQLSGAEARLRELRLQEQEARRK